MNWICRKALLVITALIFVWTLIQTVEAENNISPVVQIISFSDQNGKKPYMLWWWSASIINKEWIIISNNHVIDKWNGTIASAFLICVTRKEWEKPECDYTADLIERNQGMDLSILKISPKDIYGNNVEYDQFTTLEVDYDYQAKNQEKVIAIGYPWFGAWTLTETSGVVSWVSEYNFFKYIKTDALIAGWNSWGALVNKAWKLIWVPTFGIGWGATWSLWYSLSIWEAKEFISTNISKTVLENSVKQSIDFPNYRKTIEQINEKLLLQDNSFDFKIPENYKVKNYYKNEYIELSQKKIAKSLLKTVVISMRNERKFSTQESFLYYLESQWFYNKFYHKLLKRNIWGIDFYYAVNKKDLWNWDHFGNYYFWYYKNKIVKISINAAFHDDTIRKELKKELEKLFTNLSFNTKSFWDISYTFEFNIPKISLPKFEKTISNTTDYTINFSDKLYEYSRLSIWDLVWEFQWKWKTIEEIFNITLSWIDRDKKTLISLNGLKWFYFCNNNGFSFSPYKSRAGYPRFFFRNDEKGKKLDLWNCQIILFYPLDDTLGRQTFIHTEVLSTQENLHKNLGHTLVFMEKYLKTETLWETNMPNILASVDTLLFNDLESQSREYKRFLQILSRYDLIKEWKVFNGNKAVTWWEFISNFVPLVHKITLNKEDCENEEYQCIFSKTDIQVNWEKISLDSVLRSIGIHYSEHVQESSVEIFRKALLYKLAWISVWDFTYSDMAEFEKFSHTKKFESQKSQLDAYYKKTYWDRKIAIHEIDPEASMNFNSSKQAFFYEKGQKLFYKNLSEWESKVVLNFKKSAQYLQGINMKNCLDFTAFSEYRECQKKNSWLTMKAQYGVDIPVYERYQIYKVLQKGKMLQIIFAQADFAHFDEELQKKKETTIEEVSGQKY